MNCSEKTVEMCSIVNIHSGNCPENCSFCTQSSHNSCKIETYESIDITELIRHAKALESKGVSHLSLVASGRAPSEKILQNVKQITEQLLKETKLKICCSLGLLTRETALFLKSIGISRYHHNLESSPGFFSSICTTHNFTERLETLDYAAEASLEICSGGIFNLGETEDDRIEMIEIAVKKGATSVPFNVLSPVEGTPLYGRPTMNEKGLLHTIERISQKFPNVVIRFAGGRTQYRHSLLVDSFNRGVRGFMIGNYLTTNGFTIDDDIELIGRYGYTIIP
ncbi:MAG: biotin synthase BioB [Spirochaetes bacterium]|jgi:biotin synthase|nr:biotin synthase BioB [Spirochaetota bacterium]